jgi:wyosine [tRNA(Phe)-imidazoG37] synthetase (radical SAM superfamily)
MSIVFGPVPSRRLGRSLGINNIPHKNCSYSCLYCQVGATDKQTISRCSFYSPQDIYQAITEKLGKLRAADEAIDYLTFVPDGEPTLDINLGRTIELLRPLQIPIAVISNASLLWHEDVRTDLSRADWVSVKLDSVNEQTWQQVNRPHEVLQLERVLEGIRQFAGSYKGQLVSETMLLDGINDDDSNLHGIAEFLHETHIRKAYLGIPTRPTAQHDVQGPDETALNRAYQTLSGKLSEVEYLIGYEGDAFAFSGDAREDLLSITSVHPMRDSAVISLLHRAGADRNMLQALLQEGALKKVHYLGNEYYVRTFRHDQQARDEDPR